MYTGIEFQQNPFMIQFSTKHVVFAIKMLNCAYMPVLHAIAKASHSWF